VLRTLAATAVMAEVVIIVLVLLRAAGVDATSTAGAAVLTVVGGLVGVAAFAVTAAWLRSEEITEVVERLERVGGSGSA
jgi:hypothetical protein